MASLYLRGDIYWVKFRTASGVKQCTTHCRRDVASQVRAARRIQTEKTVLELQLKLERPAPAKAPGWTWVSDFFLARYSGGTLERYLCCWDTLQIFLREKAINTPGLLRRQHCFDYLAWRLQPGANARGRYRAGRNTALLELKVLRVIMGEALVRDFTVGNPCVQLGLKKAPRKLKPALTDEHYAMIEAGIAQVEDLALREFYANSFAIARYQGCRISETRLNPQTAVNLADGIITFHTKGGRDIATMLHPKLVPLFARLRREGRTTTWEPPPNSGRQWASSKWFKLLDKIKLKEVAGDGACFHSTRVTSATRLVQANVHPSKAKAYMIHAGTLTHELYQRLQPADLSECAAALD